jgi:small redox-active disulfide protein 2
VVRTFGGQPLTRLLDAAALMPGNARRIDLEMERERIAHSEQGERKMEVKVLGTGCAKCKSTLALIDEVAKSKGVAIELVKVEAMRDIVGYGVMSTPAVVVDGKVVHTGGVPARDKVEQWLSP